MARTLADAFDEIDDDLQRESGITREPVAGYVPVRDQPAANRAADWDAVWDAVDTTSPQF